MDKVRIGIIGTGRLGMEHAINLAGGVANAELVAICDMDGARAKEACDRLGVSKCFTDPSEMCKDSEVEAVVIVTNTDSHVDMIKTALEAGKHVFCEKPLADTVEKCKAAEEVVAAHKDQIFQLGFHRRFDRSYMLAKEKIDRGDIGKIVLIRCYSEDPKAIIDGTIEYGPRSGGQFIDMAIHDIDMIRHLSGAEPKKLWAIGGCFEYPQLATWDDGDNVSCLMQMDNGVMAFLYAGRAAAHGAHIETEIVGTNGSLVISHVPADSMLEIMDEHGVRQECYQDFLTRWHDAYITELTDFCDNVLNRKQGNPGVKDGTAATAIALACKRSFLSGELEEM